MEDMGDVGDAGKMGDTGEAGNMEDTGNMEDMRDGDAGNMALSRQQPQSHSPAPSGRTPACYRCTCALQTLNS